MAGNIKASEYNAIVARINHLSTIEKKGSVGTLSNVKAGVIEQATEIVLLQNAIHKLESSFSNNCCQSVNNDCCQSCQSCQGCQGCQTISCQSCQSCQGCQSQSCQSQKCQSCQRQCDCNCNC